MKTPGQQVYEIASPPKLRVVSYSNRKFATFDDSFEIPVERHVPWKFLTSRAKKNWEKYSQGHHAVNKE